MRIVILTNNALPAREGIGRHVTETARRLQARGHAVLLLARGAPFAGWRDGVVEGLRARHYPHFPIRPLHHAADRRALQGWLDAGAEGADLIHVHLPLLPPLRARQPLIATFHTPMLMDTAAVAEPGLGPRLARLHARLLSRRYEQWYLDHASSVLAVSDRVRRELEAGYRTAGRRIEVVENGVDTEFFAFRPVDRRAPELLYVGRLGWRKGLRRLLDAFARLAARRSVRLVLAGEGPLEPQLRSRARRLGIADRVDFPGFLDRDAVRRRLQRAACFVSPSDYEGFPLTLLEAMACGAPVVTTRTGPIADDPAGFPVLAVDATVDGLAGGIEAAVGDPVASASRARAARRLVERRYAWDRVVDALEASYGLLPRLAA
jgi:glycosyltransferase involved in cell wall biosynthesis